MRQPPFPVASLPFVDLLARLIGLPGLVSGGTALSAGVGLLPFRIPRGGIASGASGTALAYEPIVQTAAARHSLAPDLVRSVIRVESGFNPLAVSSAGAQGLMQLMPGTARGLGVQNSFDPVENINAGAAYLKRQLDAFGSVPLALAAYHAGPNAVREHAGIPPFSTTQRYVERVMHLLQSGGGGWR